MIPVKVESVSLSNLGFIVLLRREGDKKTLPIVIGKPEAESIAMRLGKLEAPRPLTHDLFRNVLEFLEVRVRRIEINDLRENTFFARLVLDSEEGGGAVDARPSDAIALALRFGAPIFVAEHVMDKAAVELGGDGTVEKPGTAPAAQAGKAPAARKEPLSPLEHLRNLMDSAVKAERYEEAAQLRDKIAKIEKGGAA